VPSSTGETLTIHNPSDDSLVSDKIQVASEADVDKAVAAAKAALPGWRAMPGTKRAACMFKLADLIEKNTPRLAKLESIAMGQPIGVANAFVHLPVEIWRYYAGLADKTGGESYPENGDGLFKIVTYEPLGVCAGIAAWNATILYTGWKVRLPDYNPEACVTGPPPDLRLQSSGPGRT
jgi:aldehyde dehydrogenase (NAD+)